MTTATKVSIMQAEAAKINDFFQERKILARIVGGFAAPSMYVYQLEMASSQPYSKLTDSLDDLQRVLYSWRVKSGICDGSDHRQRVVCRCNPQPLVLEISRPAPQILELSNVPWQPKPFKALAGVAYATKQGQAVVWDLADPAQPHCLIAGTSGSGKSNLEMAIAVTLATGTAPSALTLFVVDGGNSTLQLLAKLSHTAAFAGDADGALRLVRNVAAIVLDRKQRSETSATHRVLLIVDELANLLAVMDKRSAEQLQRDLAAIAAEGRKFGVHLMACTQKPLAEVTGSLTKSNMALRFVGLMLSKSDANVAADMPDSGAERLAGNGDFIIRRGPMFQRFQAPLVLPQAAIQKANQAWRGEDAAAIHDYLLSLGEDGETDEDELDGETDSAGVSRETVARIPDALLSVFAQFTTPDGGLRRGGVAAALRAMYGVDAPQSGKRYQVEYDRVMAWHNEYFTSLHDTSTTGRTPVLPVGKPVSVGSEVKQDGQVWY